MEASKQFLTASKPRCGNCEWLAVINIFWSADHRVSSRNLPDMLTTEVSALLWLESKLFEFSGRECVVQLKAN